MCPAQKETAVSAATEEPMSVKLAAEPVGHGGEKEVILPAFDGERVLADKTRVYVVRSGHVCFVGKDHFAFLLF